MRHVFPALLMAAALTATPSQAGADKAKPAGKADANKGDTSKADAQRLLLQGNDAANDGDYLTALEHYRKAYALYPSPKLLLNIGAMLRSLGRNVEAAGVYESYQKDAGADPARAPDVARFLGEIDALVGRIRVKVSHPGATVRIDGNPIEAAELASGVRVDPGEHTVVANHPRYPPAVVNIKLAGKEDRLVELALVPPDEKTEITSPRRVAGIVLGAAGMAGLVAGGVSGIVAAVENHAAASHCIQNVYCDAEGVRLGAIAKTSATVSTAALIAGGAFAVAGVVVYLTAPRSLVVVKPPTKERGKDARLAPGALHFTVGLSGAGPALRWEGVF
jgi:tetratricopeptide (TPR) repeat protein